MDAATNREEPVEIVEEKKEIVLTREEYLEADNLRLQLHLTNTQKENFLMGAQKQIEAFDNKLLEIRQQITATQAKLSKKYDIDFKKQQIESGTGRIIPAP